MRTTDETESDPVRLILPDGTPAKIYMEKLRLLEAEAREKRLGVWADAIDPKPIRKRKARTK